MDEEGSSFAPPDNPPKRAAGLAPGQLILRALRRAAKDSSLEGAVEHVLTTITEALGAASAAVFTLNEADETTLMRWVCGKGKLRPGNKDETHPFAGQPVPRSRFLAWEKRFGPKASPFLIHLEAHPDVSEELRAWARREGYATILAVPLRHGGDVLGSLSLRFPDGRTLDTQELDIAHVLANEAALVLGFAERAEEKRVAAVLSERDRMAGEMHDTIAQGLSGIAMRVDMALANLGPTAGAREHLEIAALLTRETLSQARRAVWDLGAKNPGDGDIVRCLKRLTKDPSAHGATRVEVKIDGIVPELPHAVADALFQIAREGVANALRHAQARTIAVALTVDSSELRLDVADDGRGFVALPKAVRRGYGLTSMERRANKIGGDFSLHSRLGEGARIGVTLPLSSLRI